MAETLPVVNGSSGTWGTILNTAIGNIDTRLAAATTTNTTQDTNISNLTSRVTTLENGSTGGLSSSLFTTKGDLLVGTGSSAVSRLGVSTNTGFALLPNTSATTGMTWQLNPGAVVFKGRGTSAQNIGDQTDVYIQWTEDYDRLNTFAGNGNTYSPGIAGWYELTATVSFSTASTTGYRALYWDLNASILNGSGASQPAHASIATMVNARPMTVLLSASDGIALRAYHNGGATLTTNATAQFQPSIAVKYLGPS